LKGFTVGGGVRWESKSVIGYYGKTRTGMKYEDWKTAITTFAPTWAAWLAHNGSDQLDMTISNSDPSRPIYDSARAYADFWIGYSHKLSESLRLKIQLNVNNAFESGRLQVIQVNWDGSPFGYRIVDPRQFVLRTTLEF